MTKAEFQAALGEVTTALDNIAADIERLTGQLQTGGMTKEEEQEVFDQLKAVAQRAKDIAATTPEIEAPEPEAPIGSSENPGVEA